MRSLRFSPPAWWLTHPGLRRNRRACEKGVATENMISRDRGAPPMEVAERWSWERLIPPSRLFGANGLRTGPDGRIYVAQVTGSQISALDIQTGQLETVSPKGGDIIAPDDVAFDLRGDLYATEVMDGRVSVRRADGRAQVLRDDVPSANGITVHDGRLFVNECRVDGRLLEIDLNGGMPRVILEGVPMPNAMEVGPDGLLYYPVMGTNDIWRIDPNGGNPQRVVGGLGVPDAVKFDDEGFIVSTQVQTGEVLRIDPRNGRRTVLATVAPGLDNLTFVGDRVFVSSFTGQITEILRGGETRAALPGGLNWPLDLTVDTAGNLYVADGTYFYVVRPGGTLQTLGMLFSPAYPGFIRGLTSVGGGEFIVTTSNGEVASYRPERCESNVARRRVRPALRGGHRSRWGSRGGGTRDGPCDRVSNPGASRLWPPGSTSPSGWPWVRTAPASSQCREQEGSWRSSIPARTRS